MIQIYVYLCLLSALSFVEMKPLNIKGHVGKKVTIKCSDWTSVTDVKYNDKYFCNSPCTKDKHIIVQAAFGKTKRKNQIQLTNSAEGLFVTFTDLQKSDSRKYYCGVDRFGPDSFIEVNLKVTDAESSRIKTTPKSVIVASTLDFTFKTSSTVSSNSSHVITDMSTSDIIHSTTSSSSATGSVPYLIIGVLIVVMTMLMVLLKLMRKMMNKQLKEEDTREDAEHDEIRPEDQRTVRQPTGVSTLHFSPDPDSLYTNCSYHKDTELAACAESRIIDPQCELLYSVVQLPKEQTEPPGQPDPNHSESNENDSLYSLVQLTQAT